MIDYYDISETWHPTNVLGTKGGVLYQQWRRRLTKFEQWPGASRPMLTHSIEYEWRTIAEIGTSSLHLGQSGSRPSMASTTGPTVDMYQYKLAAELNKQPNMRPAQPPSVDLHEVERLLQRAEIGRALAIIQRATGSPETKEVTND